MHAANSAATMRDVEAHFDMVRCGIAIYGMDPFGRDPAARALEPALELRSCVAEVKLCAAGESAGYGRRFVAEPTPHRCAADRLRRRLAARPVQQRRRADPRTPLSTRRHRQHGQHHGRPRPCSRRRSGSAAQRAILIGVQASERITAEEVARRWRRSTTRSPVG